MKYRLIFFFALLLITISSCLEIPSKTSDKIAESGWNRIELYKLLNHYRDDSLKFQAALFLIDNSSHHYSLENQQSKHYSLFADKVCEFKKRAPVGSHQLSTALDSLWNTTQLPNSDKESKIHLDIKNISANQLIENIDYAFLAWEYPWCKHLSFEQFCEYILPYRYGHERVEFWRKEIYENTTWLTDSMRGSTDPIIACKYVNSYLKSWFITDDFFQKVPYHPTAGELMKVQMGTCMNQTAITTLVMRAVGIPVVNEEIIKWGNHHMGHNFNGVLSKSGKFIPFQGADIPPGEYSLGRSVPKIFRRYFSKQLRPAFDINPNGKYRDSLKSLTLKEVTSEYVSVSNITLPLPSGVNPERVVLSLFNNRRWVATHYGEVKGNRAIFNNMGRVVCYLPLTIDKYGEATSFHAPFTLETDGSITTLKGDQDSVVSFDIVRKYPPNGRLEALANNMIGGRFQGANRSDFSDAVNLHQIVDSLSSLEVSTPLSNKKRYRYYRYKFPTVSAECFGNVADISFYQKEKTVSGTTIAPPYVTNYQKSSLFDGKLNNYVTALPSSVETDWIKEHTIIVPDSKVDSLWIGIDTGVDGAIIDKISFAPRNDTNNIYKGMKYQLYYWSVESEGWISLGYKVASSSKLQYTNIPKGALLWLHNYTEGKEERIFTIRDNNIVWY